MISYALENGKLKPAELGPVIIAGRHELTGIPCAITEWMEYDGAHSCKVEFEGDWIYGSLVMPDKDNLSAAKKVVRFICSEEKLIVIGDNNDGREIVERLLTVKHGFSSIGDAFLTMLERLIYEDIFCIYKIEEKLQKLEAVVLLGAEKDINKAILSLSRQLQVLHSYYEQLVAMGERIEDEEFFSEERQLHTFIDKSRRLDTKVYTLLDYCKQIRESFRAEIDMRMNRVMKTLTVITTLFMPVTVISAWYGMNFRGMPELSSPFGYWIVTGVTLLFTVSAIVFCRYKKLL